MIDYIKQKGKLLMIQLKKRIDCHVHYALPLAPETLVSFMDETNTAMANLVLVPHTQRLSALPDAMMAKYRYPDRFYVFASLDPSVYYRHPKTLGKYMAAHAKRMRRCGCDGIKIIEGKPNMRRILPIPHFDLPCWEPFWAYAEAEQLPILWHVNDPEEYWHPEQVSEYRRNMGDVYGENDVGYEEQYQQVFRVLQKHPKLKIIFAHFFFLSGQLERLGNLLDTYPNIRVDVTPGSEMYRILSENHDEAQAFFQKYHTRILYGTDAGARCVMTQLMSGFHLQENLNRVALINSFFSPETDEIHSSDGAYLLDVPDFVLKGLDLTEDELDHIFCKNFQSFAGQTPAPVQPRPVIQECRRIIITLKIMGLIDRKLSADPSAAKSAITFFKKAKN